MQKSIGLQKALQNSINVDGLIMSDVATRDTQIDWFLEDDPLLGGRMSDDLMFIRRNIWELGLKSLKRKYRKKILDKTQNI